MYTGRRARAQGGCTRRPGSAERTRASDSRRRPDRRADADQLTERARGPGDDRASTTPRLAGEELVGAMMELYGDGLARIVRARGAGDAACQQSASGSRDGVGGQPAADPRPLPGRPRDAGARGARRRAPLHGVARRRRRAARHRGRRRAAAPRRPAATAARRRPRRSSWRSSRRSTRPRPTCRTGGRGGRPATQSGSRPSPGRCRSGSSTATAGRPRTWIALTRPATSRPGELRTLDAGGGRARRGQRRRHAARLPQRLRRRATPPSATATLSGEILTCARCGRGFDLPRAGRALGSEEGQLEPVPLLGRAGTKVKVALAPPPSALAQGTGPPGGGAPWT